MRYAIYFVPRSDSALYRFGSALLGYDCFRGAELQPIRLGLAEAQWRALISEPRRYGFHATLKAPFRLRPGVSEGTLLAALEGLAAAAEPVSPIPLKVAVLERFVALVPKVQAPALDRLACLCVETFEPFRAPLDANERARRLRAPLTARQLMLLERWGYPYVFDEFCFHMTLAGPLETAARETLVQRLRRAVRCRLGEPVAEIDQLTLLRQTSLADPFVVIHQVPLGRLSGAA